MTGYRDKSMESDLQQIEELLVQTAKEKERIKARKTSPAAKGCLALFLAGVPAMYALLRMNAVSNGWVEPGDARFGILVSWAITVGVVVVFVLLELAARRWPRKPPPGVGVIGDETE